MKWTPNVSSQSIRWKVNLYSDRIYKLHNYYDQFQGVAPTDPEIYIEIEPEKMAKTLNALKVNEIDFLLKLKSSESIPYLLIGSPI